ncbi:MAG: DNA repair protein RadC [Bacilli bacterium]|nr:DNA repair protein RadC [Bacilli bacterium]
MLIKEMNEVERPRERLLNLGASKLTNEELLAIILKTGMHGKSSKDLAIELIEKLGGLSNFKNINLNNLRDFKGIGDVKKIELLATLEFGKRVYLDNSLKSKKQYVNPNFIYLDNKYLFYGLQQEYFYVFYLDTKKNLIERKILFMGTLNKSLVHPREIFKNAYLLSASSFICMHNHPTGDIVPSRADIELTNTLIELGKLNGIEILDHIIVSDSGYFSFYENHLMDGPNEG